MSQVCYIQAKLQMMTSFNRWIPFPRSRYWTFAVSCFERLAESGASGVFLVVLGGCFSMGFLEVSSSSEGMWSYSVEKEILKKILVKCARTF